MGPEAKVKDAVKKLFAKLDIHPAGKDPESYDSYNGWYYMPVQNGMGVAGIPDFIACVNGEFVGLETKATAKKQPTALQSRNLNGIAQAGGSVFVIHPDNLDGLELALKRRIDK